MKIGIIGLKPRQIADVGARKFNGHTIEFYEEKSYSQVQVTAFARKVDRVLLLPLNAPKRISSWVLRDKLVTLAGGISTIIRYLDKLPHAESSESVEDVEVVQEAISGPVPPTPTPMVQLPRLLGQTLVKGIQSFYRWRSDITVVEPNAKGGHRYDILDAALPGDVVRMGIPVGMEQSVLRTRIAAMRYNREKTRGQLMEVHYYENYFDLFVVRTKEEGKITTEMVAAKEVVVVPVKDAKEQDVDVPVETSDVLATAASPLKETLEEFWRKCFLAFIERGLSVDEASKEAERSVRRLRTFMIHSDEP